MMETAATQPGALVDPAWRAAHLNDRNVVVIDVAGTGQEELQAYRAGHVPGAYAWKWKEMLWDERMREFPSPEDFAQRLGSAGIGNDTTVVFYGEGVQFGFYAWWTFRYCGHANVHVLDGARYRWTAEGRGLTKDEPAPRQRVIYKPVRRIEAMRIGREEVLRALDKPEKIIIDARSPEEYAGQRVSPPGGPDSGAVRHGRIPGARHLYFEDLLDRNKAFKSAAELERLFAQRSARRDREVIAYCRMSHRATVVYFALTQLLGFDRVRLYDGSWTEWGNVVGLPIER